MRSRRSEIRLRENHRAAIDAEQVENRQMLERLRHNPVIDADCQKRKIDPACAGEHRVDEALVARNVDKADRPPRSRRHVGKAQVNRDAAGLLILQPVASDTRQGFDQSSSCRDRYDRRGQQSWARPSLAARQTGRRIRGSGQCH